MAATKSTTQSVCEDWESRELAEIVQLNVLQITQFLNNFDISTRYRLARINERLNSLERTLEYAEAAVRSTNAEAPERPAATSV